MLSLSTPSATAGSSFSPALPQSLGTLAPPQPLRLLLGLQCRRRCSIPSALCLLPGIHWLPLRRSSPGHRQLQLHHGSSLPRLRCGLSSLLCSGSVSADIIHHRCRCFVIYYHPFAYSSYHPFTISLCWTTHWTCFVMLNYTLLLSIVFVISYVLGCFMSNLCCLFKMYCVNLVLCYPEGVLSLCG